jgi:cation diffusion facilitator CzcD-associated flavoprotein CzcO
MSPPLTYDTWEWGYFTEEQLRTAGAYPTDVEVDENEELFPDGGCREDLAQAKLYETELDALLEDREGDS